MYIRIPGTPLHIDSDTFLDGLTHLQIEYLRDQILNRLNSPNDSDLERLALETFTRTHSKIQTIKTIRVASGLGLRAAKDIADRVEAEAKVAYQLNNLAEELED